MDYLSTQNATVSNLDAYIAGNAKIVLRKEEASAAEGKTSVVKEETPSKKEEAAAPAAPQSRELSPSRRKPSPFPG